MRNDGKTRKKDFTARLGGGNIEKRFQNVKEKKVKKLKFILPTFLLAAVLSLTACSNASSDTGPEKKEVPTYKVTYVDGVDDLDISVPSDTNQYNEGDTVTVQFSGIGERSGYNFTGWSDGTNIFTSSGSKSFKIGSKDVVLTAQWILATVPTYTITVVDNIPNGTVTASKTIATAGETINLSAIAANRYMFDSWNVINSDGSVITVTNNSFVMPSNNVVVGASFKPVPTYLVIYNDGVDSEDISVPSDTRQYYEGDSVSVKFTGIGKRSGFSFAGWSDGKVTFTNNTSTTFVMGSANVTLTAQWLPYVGTKTPFEEKAVGDIVFRDGSAMPSTSFISLSATEKEIKKQYAIAIIFYKGKGLNSGSDVTTTRTLGVGLKQDAVQWCNKKANAYSLKIDTILCTATGSLESLTFSGDKNGSDNLEQIASFLNAANGVTDDTAIENNYPAFYFGKNYKNVTGSNVSGTDYENGWFFPSTAELYQIYLNGMGRKKVFDINPVIVALGGNTFENIDCWSSSQSKEGPIVCDEFYFIVDRGGVNCNGKDYVHPKVCAIREFN